MGVAPDAGFGQVDHLDFAAGLGDLLAEGDAGLADRRPARIALDVVAVDEQRRDRGQLRHVLQVSLAGGLDRNERLDLIGPRLRHLEAELAGLRMEQDYAGADPVHQRGVRGDDGVVRGGPARHALLDEVLVFLDRKLAARHGFFRRIAAGAVADAKALPGIRRREEYRLALDDVRIHRPARAPAL